MRENEKVLIIALVIITIVVIVFAVSRKSGDGVNSNVNPAQGTGAGTPIAEEEKYVTTTEDGTKVNTSDALATNKTVNNVEFSDIQLTERGGETLLIATVTNKGTTANQLFAVDITLIDENGQDITSITGLVAPMEAGETATFETSTTLDFANAYDFKVTAK